MKKLFLFIIALLMLCSCGTDNEPEQLISEPENKTESSEAETDYEISLTSEQLDFWNSEYGKKMLGWKTSEGYNVYFRNLENGCVLYYCEETVFLKKEDGTFVEIIDQTNVDPNLIGFDNGSISIPFKTGAWRYGNGNFPYSLIYDIETGNSYKEMWELNIASRHHSVAGAYPIDGKFADVKVDGNVAEIYFDIDLEKQTAGLDNYFPKIDFFYNEYNNTAYYYLNGISPDFEKISALEKIEGIENPEAKPFESDYGVPGTVISFVVKDGYKLYSENFKDFETSPEDHLKIWIEK